jgi:membrane-associated phospholipid phosphatase
MRYDGYVKLYEKTALFLERHKRLKGVVLALDATLPLVFYLTYPVLAVFSAWNLQTDFWRYFFAAGLPFFAFVTVTILRKIINRPRPYEDKDVNIQPLHRRTEKLGEAFPSRHAASGFVIATVLLSLCLPLGIALLVVATVMNFTRFAVGHHYPTDLIVGSLIGLAFGIPAFFI